MAPPGRKLFVSVWVKIHGENTTMQVIPADTWAIPDQTVSTL